MNKKEVQVTVKSGILEHWTFHFKYETMEEFKQSLLKRFGNIRGTNKAEQHRDKVKDLIRNAGCVGDIERISQDTGWKFEVWVKK